MKTRDGLSSDNYDLESLVSTKVRDLSALSLSLCGACISSDFLLL